jgi:hypothetical protein
VGSFPEKAIDLPMKDSRSSPDASAPAAPVGARNDDSSLFSLESLKKTEEEAARTNKSKNDDSGLIDLKALAAIAKEQVPRQQEMAVSAMVAPPDLFQMAAPLVPIAAPVIQVGPPADDMAAMRPNRTKLYIGLGAGAAVVLAGLAFLLTSGTPTPTTIAESGTSAPTTTPTATAAPPEEPKVAAVTPGTRPTATEDPKPAPTATARVAGPLPRGPSGPKPTTAPKPEGPPPKPVDACDLACQMARAVNKK